jgi:hypothetical protein
MLSKKHQGILLALVVGILSMGYGASETLTLVSEIVTPSQGPSSSPSSLPISFVVPGSEPTNSAPSSIPTARSVSPVNSQQGPPRSPTVAPMSSQDRFEPEPSPLLFQERIEPEPSPVPTPFFSDFSEMPFTIALPFPTLLTDANASTSQPADSPSSGPRGDSPTAGIPNSSPSAGPPADSPGSEPTTISNSAGKKGRHMSSAALSSMSVVSHQDALSDGSHVPGFHGGENRGGLVDVCRYPR